MTDKNYVTHLPRFASLWHYQFMHAFCGGASVSSALSLELVTCKKCLEKKDMFVKLLEGGGND